MTAGELHALVGLKVKVLVVVSGTLVGVSSDFSGELLKLEVDGGPEDGKTALSPIGEVSMDIAILDDVTEEVLRLPANSVSKWERL